MGSSLSLWLAALHRAHYVRAIAGKSESLFGERTERKERDGRLRRERRVYGRGGGEWIVREMGCSVKKQNMVRRCPCKKSGLFGGWEKGCFFTLPV